ncbi:hypothetical protein GTY65_17810 [Streptomyces sp. SID8379]|uniref:hypothetical protein n=1 Tax=unclassified Streptomyces TaxID=2593676 RepID=UPI0003806073|nr:MULTISPECIES: hypothetical protein [unclassified Streptomyces]MYW65896.1 hypothetical protein [Streptomyces sp. SID8379]
MKHLRTVAWAGITVAALTATTACSADNVKRAAGAVDKADAIMAAFGRATDKTEELGSARVKMTTTLPSTGPIVMDGTYSWSDGLAFDVEMDTAQVKMQTLTASKKMHALFVDGAYYYDIDPQPSGPLKGKEWMKIDASAMFGKDGSAAMQGGADQSPTQSLKQLKFASDVKDLGEGKVNGQTATHYRATLDKKAMGKLNDAYNGDTTAHKMLGDVDRITMDVWLDGKDLPVRMTQEMGTMTVSMDFAKFGGAKHITPPPATQTGDLTQAFKDMQAQQQG